METEDSDSNEWSDIDDDNVVAKRDDDTPGKLMINLGRKGAARKIHKGPKLVVSIRKRKSKKECLEKSRWRTEHVSATSLPQSSLPASRPSSAQPTTAEVSVVGDPAIDTNIDRAAKKLNMNRTQVKTVIRRVLESPDLINLIVNKAEEGQSKDSRSRSPTLEEPRLTRGKAKCVKESGGKLDWVLEKFDQMDLKQQGLSKTPLKSGTSATNSSAAMASKSVVENDYHSYLEFVCTTVGSASAEESRADVAKETVDDTDDDDDQDFDPSKDTNEHSDEDDSVLNSDAGTPHQGSITPASTSSLTTPKPSLTKEYGHYFKQPFSAGHSHVARVLDFEGDSVGGETVDQKITRQRSNLKDVTIKELDAKLAKADPDLIPDMFYFDGDENYVNFLSDYFYKPLNEDDTQPEELDPDFDLLDEEIEETAYDRSTKNEEFRFDRSTKIPQKEAEELINEIVAEYDLEYTAKDNEQGPKRQKHSSAASDVTKENNSTMSNSTSFVASTPAIVEVLTSDDVEVILHQMCQHVQLLTQMTLLTGTSSGNKQYNEECKQMAMEVYGHIQEKEHFASVQALLSDSLGLIDTFEKEGHASTTSVASRQKTPKYELSPALLASVSQSPAFRYPTLLPDNSLAAFHWSESEDYLLALGLEYAVGAAPDANKKKEFNFPKLSKVIQERLVKGKTSDQICKRIKNQKCRAAQDLSNPLTRFFHHGVAGRLPRLPMLVLQAGVTVRAAPAHTLAPVWKKFLGLVDEPGSSLPPEVQRSSVQYLPQKCQPSPESSGMPLLNGSQQTAIVLQYGSTSVPIMMSMPEFHVLPEDSESAAKTEQELTSQPTKKRGGRKFYELSPSVTQISTGTVEAMETGHDESQAINILDMAVEECGISGLTLSPIKMGKRTDERSATSERRPEGAHVTNISYTQECRGKKRTGSDPTLSSEEETEEEMCARKEIEAAALFSSAQKQLDAQKMAHFVQILIANEHSPMAAFPLLNVLCADHPELQLMLLDLLSPSEAAALNVGDAFDRRQRQKAFFRMLRRLNSPARNKDVLDKLSVVLSGHVDVASLIRAAESLFAENANIKETFLALVPKSI